MSKISCIICAFNEEPRINTVLSAINGHPLIDEVIVIDDGSTDGTDNVVRKHEWAKLIVHEKNMGKSQAMCTGILAAQNSQIMFLDADLIGITKENITSLAMPVVEGKSDITISLRQNSLWIYRFIGLDFVSGERVMDRKYIMENMEEIKKLPGYGIEVFMNRLMINHKLRISIVDWNNVRLATKQQKLGFWKGTVGEIKMLRQIMKVVSLKEVFYQNYKLLKLRVR